MDLNSYVLGLMTKILSITLRTLTYLFRVPYNDLLKYVLKTVGALGLR